MIAGNHGVFSACCRDWLAVAKPVRNLRYAPLVSDERFCMKTDVMPVIESLLMLIYIVASLASFFYFSYSLLVDLAAAVAFASDVGFSL
jgi:hypothetical protein